MREASRHVHRHHRAAIAHLCSTCLLCSVLLCATLCMGCERTDPAPIEDDDQSASADRQRSPYHQLGAARIAALPTLDDDQALAEAVAAAQQSLDEARTRWLEHDAAAQQRWAVKWAAATVEGIAEHLWVRPILWSEHRIEGVLLNAPSGELLAARARGDMVSFSTSDVTDWVCFTSDDSDAKYEGGYTLRLIEDRTASTPDRE